MAQLLRNDPSQSIPASNAALENIERFKRESMNFAELAATSNGMEGATDHAMNNAGQRVLEATQRFKAATDPRIEAIRQGAEDATRTGDEGQSALAGVDVSFG